MDYGVSTHLFVSERLSSHSLDQIFRAGFRTFEIFAARQHFDYRDKNQVRDVAQWFEDHDARLHSLHAPMFDDFAWGREGGLAISIAHLERRLRIDSMDEIKRALEIAERLPFRYLILHMGVAHEEFDLQKFDAALTSIEHLKVFAKESGTQLLLENTPNELSSPERLVEFIHYSRFDDLGICFDTGHAHLTCGVQEAFEVLKDRIASTHVHDNRGDKDAHLLPYEGGIDWTRTIADFRTRDGRFPLIFELRHDGPNPFKFQVLHRVIERFEAVE